MNSWLLPLLLCTPARAQEGVHDAVVVLFDTSGSMDEPMDRGGTRMDVARPALQTVLAKIPADTWVGLLTFQGWQYELGPRDDARIAQAISTLDPRGKTPLGQYLKVGADRLLEEREKQHGYGSYRLVVVTDGQATDEDVMSAYAGEVPARRIRMDVIGLAMKDEHVLAQSAHSYQPAHNAQQLDEALRRVVVESRGDGANPSEDFALIADIPDDVAAAWVTAVTEPAANWPIGAPPPSPEPEALPAPMAPPDAPKPPESKTCATVSGVTLLGLAGMLLVRKRQGR